MPVTGHGKEKGTQGPAEDEPAMYSRGMGSRQEYEDAVVANKLRKDFSRLQVVSVGWTAANHAWPCMACINTGTLLRTDPLAVIVELAAGVVAVVVAVER